MTESNAIPARKRLTVTTPPMVEAVRHAAMTPSFDDLPDSALVRQSQLVRDPKHPMRPAPLPFSSATLWRKIKNGTFVKPVKLGARITCWPVGAVRAWIAAQTQA